VPEETNHADRTLAELGERAALRRLLPLLPAVPAPDVGPGDDCAVLRVRGAGEDLLLTSDPVIEGVHFEPGADPARVDVKPSDFEKENRDFEKNRLKERGGDRGLQGGRIGVAVVNQFSAQTIAVGATVLTGAAAPLLYQDGKLRGKGFEQPRLRSTRRQRGYDGESPVVIRGRRGRPWQS